MTPVESGTRVRYHGSTGYCREKEFRVYNALPDAVKDEHTSEDGYRYGIYSTRHSWNSKLGLATV